MEIKTKFDIGQKVWFVNLGMIKHFYISGIQIFTTEIHNYYFDNLQGIWYGENLLFATKEEAEQKLKEIENAENKR